MEKEQIIEKIQEKLLRISNEADVFLRTLNEQASKNPAYNVTTRLELPSSYYRDVAVYAWGARGQKIACIMLQGLLNELRKDL